MNKRVVITGLGVFSAIGCDTTEFSNSLRNNKSGIRKIQRFNTTGYRTNTAGEINTDSLKVEDKKNNCLQYILKTTDQAFNSANIDLNDYDRSRIGVSIATSLGCVDLLSAYIQRKQSGEACLFEMIKDIPHCIPSASIASYYQLEGPIISIDTACASGSNSIGYAFDLIKNDECDMMITGGVDVLSQLSYSGFNIMMNLTKTVCRPFDRNREGLVLGEGAATIILESLENALKRNASIYGEVLGYGLSNDAYHETQPNPEARGAITAMTMALEDAHIPKERIDYINAHGTGTKLNDLMEVRAIRSVFGDHTRDLKISSIKAALGHTLGAAGAIEFLATVMSISKDFIPPTLNFETPIEGYEDMDFVPNFSKEYPLNVAMSNSFGFAGNCCSILLGKYVN